MNPMSPANLQVSERLATKHGLLEETHQHVRSQTVRNLDSERVPLRVERLLINPLVKKTLTDRGVADELHKLKSLEDLTPAAQSELERVISGADFMPTWFLSRGAELRRTVARVRARTANGIDIKGTGFMVGPQLLLTNFHVLDWTDMQQAPLADIVQHSLVEFDFEEQYNGRMQAIASFRLDPATLLLASPIDQLDYVLVAVKPIDETQTVSIDSFGYNRLAGDQGKINKGEPVFIIQHPNGQPKQVVIQNNRLIDRDEALPYLTYEADTESGSSGSPVFNRQWEVVALHHSTEMARNPNGDILAKDGSVWKEAMGSGQIKYLSLNEGIRVSRLLADLVKKFELVGKNGLAALGRPEQCSSQGLKLLEAALQTRMGAEPGKLIVSVPTTEATGLTAKPRTRKMGGFPAPD
jgi:endonuclease G, mitochondrial